MEKILPNFLLIGAAKSGTTSLYNYLHQHPQVFMSELKEPRFFIYEGQQISDNDLVNRKTVTDINDYHSLFQGVTKELAIGEASGYLASADAADRIKKYLPNVKLVAILRNPVDRAFSHHTFAVQKGFENEVVFQAALEKELQGTNDCQYTRTYIHQGMYHKNLLPFYRNFPPENIKVVLYEDLVQDRIGLIKDIYTFLNVDPSFVPDLNVRMNKSGIPKHRKLYELYQKGSVLRDIVRSLLPKTYRGKLNRWIENRSLRKLHFPDELRHELAEYFKEDITGLEMLINRDLSGWKA